jgi:acetyl esterase/lipase
MLAAPKARADETPATKPPPAKTFAVKERGNLAYRGLEKGEILPIGNLLDLYLPSDGKDFPVLVLVHGGAWTWGDKRLDFIPEVARCLARQGIGVVAPNYRLSPLFQHPAHARDAAKALAWTKKHIPEYGGRADQIFLLGHSAGGHLVSLLATDESYLKKAGLSRRDIKGVITVSGVYHVSDVTLNIVIKNTQMKLDAAVTANPFTSVFGKDADVAKQASPITHVREGLPPFLILHASEELPGLSEMADKFHSALKGKKCEAQLLKVPRRNHGTVLWKATKPDDPVVVATVTFITQHKSRVQTPPIPVELKFEQVAPEHKTAATFARSPNQNRAVVLVHGLRWRDGLASHKANFESWQRSNSTLVKTLKKDADVFAFAYGQNVAVDRIAELGELTDNLRRVRQLGYNEVILVGHSAGGLIVRQMVEDYAGLGVTKVIQVSAPNGGSDLGRGSGKPFVASLAKQERQAFLLKRADKNIPANVEFVCVVSGTLGTDLMVLCSCQWTDDLQQQGIPAFALHKNHHNAIASQAGADLIAQLVREKQPRWDSAKVAAEKKTILGAGKAGKRREKGDSQAK